MIQKQRPPSERTTRFWHPVGMSQSLATGAARSLRIRGEELTLFRGQDGLPYLVGQCAKGCTTLHAGTVEAAAIRCTDHGWKYSGAEGTCVETPGERNVNRDDAKIPAYLLEEYAGVIFAYFGPDPEPEFELPRESTLVRSRDRIIDGGRTSVRKNRHGH